jgi:hypothetical protein
MKRSIRGYLVSIDEELDKVFDNIIVESRTPKVGIFWVNGPELIVFADDVRKVREVAGFKDSDHNHYEDWSKLKLKGDYTSIPRGRVLYSVRDDKYLVYIPTSLSRDRATLSKIFREFSLPTSKIKVSTDEHYDDDANPFGDDDYWD